MRKAVQLIGVLALGSVLTSCLDDKVPALDPASSTNVIEFKNPAGFTSPFGSKYALYSQAFDLAPENNYPLTVSYSGAQVAPEDITVTLGVDAAALTQYSTEQEAEYDLIPTNLYILPASVVIPKGKRTATVDLKFKSINFDFAKAYVLPVQIKSVSSGIISGNFGTILLSVNAKNKYDGVYSVTGTMVDAAPAGVAFKHLSQVGRPLEYSFESISATKCVVVDYPYFGGSPAHAFYTGTAVSGYGSYAAVVEFDPATNKVIGVTNFYGQPAANNRSGRLDPSGVNTYNPATKTLDISYFMVQPSVIAAPPNVRVSWKEQWKFVHPR